MRTLYLEVLLENSGELFSLHLVVVDPGLDGDRGVLRGWNTVWTTETRVRA
jgi:hypothetical protein